MVYNFNKLLENVIEETDEVGRLIFESANFKVSSFGWEQKKQKAIIYKESPTHNIWEYVSGVSRDLIGEQLFTWDAAIRETKNAGKRMPTKEEWVESKKNQTINIKVFPGYYEVDGGLLCFYGIYAYFWLSTQYDVSRAWNAITGVKLPPVCPPVHNKACGFSVRCVK